MIIGFDAKRAFQNRTGLGNYSRMLICGMAQKYQNVRAFLYSPDMSGEYKGYFSGFANISTRQPSGVDRHFPNLWRRFGVTTHLKGDKIDIFHGLSHELPHGIPRSIKKVVTMHDLIVFRFPEFFKPADRVIHRLKMRHACRVADVVVAISEQTKCDLMEFLEVPEEKIRVVYQSCDSAFWGVKGSEEGVKGSERTNVEVREKYGLPERYILCVGTLEERKNQLRVIEAMKRLPQDVALVLVGRPRGDYGQRVLACTNERVRVLSGASFTDFPSLYRGAVASVYLSRFEGFGIPVLESLCCDCPVVTSDVSSMPEAGGDAALYAAPEDVDTVAAHLLRLCTDETFRQERIEKGRLQRRKFAPEKVSADMMEVYKSLL